MKEEEEFYRKAGSSRLVRLVAWLTQPRNWNTGRVKARPAGGDCTYQAARLARP